MPEANAPRALRRRCQEHLWRGGVRVFLEEVMLDFPRVVDPEPIGELDLRQRVLKELQLRAVVPRARQLVLVEDPEFHDGPFAGRRGLIEALLEFARAE